MGSTNAGAPVQNIGDILHTIQYSYVLDSLKDLKYFRNWKEEILEAMTEEEKKSMCLGEDKIPRKVAARLYKTLTDGLNCVNATCEQLEDVSGNLKELFSGIKVERSVGTVGISIPVNGTFDAELQQNRSRTSIKGINVTSDTWFEVVNVFSAYKGDAAGVCLTGKDFWIGVVRADAPSGMKGVNMVRIIYKDNHTLVVDDLSKYTDVSALL